jgi:hypothetical protein
MARIISGLALIIWAVAILASPLWRDIEGTRVHATGRKLAWAFAVALVALGKRAILKGRKA